MMKKNIGICDVPNKDIYAAIHAIISETRERNAHDVCIFTKGYTKFTNACASFAYPEMSLFSGLLLSFVVEDMQTILNKKQDIKLAFVYLGQHFNIPLLMALLKNKDIVILTGNEKHHEEIQRLSGVQSENIQKFIETFLED